MVPVLMWQIILSCSVQVGLIIDSNIKEYNSYTVRSERRPVDQLLHRGSVNSSTTSYLVHRSLAYTLDSTMAVNNYLGRGVVVGGARWVTYNYVTLHDACSRNIVEMNSFF